MNSNGVINKGNADKLKDVMQRARNGENIKVAFLGGSITQGCLSSKPTTCYAYLVYKWWENNFPESAFTYINAGIGGTTSQFGVSRVKQHVLALKPDFILTEFAVNDENTEFFMETYEGLVRCIMKACPKSALLLMNNVRFDTGENAEEIHLKVAKHYDVPMLSMKRTIFAAIQNGEIVKENISEDMLHPNDEGHELIAKVITDYLDNVLSDIDKKNTDCNNAKFVFPDKSLTPNRYENSIRIKNYNMEEYGVKLLGFTPDSHEKKDFLDIFSGGFTACKIGDAIEFYVCAKSVAINYKKTVNLPAPVACAVIDDMQEEAVVLDANFDETWGDCLFVENIKTWNEAAPHKIRIELTKCPKGDFLPFYLVSVIISV